MNLVMGDVLHADTIELLLPRTPLAAGQTHSSMEENLKALFESLGLELMAYEAATHTPLGQDFVAIKLVGRAWLRNLHG